MIKLDHLINKLSVSSGCWEIDGEVNRGGITRGGENYGKKTRGRTRAAVDMVIKTPFPHCHGSALCSRNKREFKVKNIIRTKRGTIFSLEQVRFDHLITLI